jgi:polysaccharide pyruvyl transferase WcaK-like protein
MNDARTVDEKTCSVSNERASTGPLRPRAGVQVCLLGASFETGNLGVSMLAEGSVQCILARWPDARIMLLGSSRQDAEIHLQSPQGEIPLRTVPVRFSKRVWLPCHFLILASLALLSRVLPFAAVRRWIAAHNPYMDLLLRTDCFIDISGGDSFSDIYGMRRLVQAFLTRQLPLWLKKDLVLFPQTYGPFKKAVSRALARYTFQRCRTVYSRDRKGLEYVRDLLKGRTGRMRLDFAPDVAFVVAPRKPRDLSGDGLDRLRDAPCTVVGMNVSGLIYYGGYRGGNEFGLGVNYRELMARITSVLLEQPDVRIVFVPHVVPRQGHVENDRMACLDLYGQFSATHHDRLFVAQGRYDHCEIKYVVGLCDFFVGARMHSCIAALSQGIPAVGLAYSKKFHGVFETAGVEELVLDMRNRREDDIITSLLDRFDRRGEFASRLEVTVPQIKGQVLRIVEDLTL